MTNDDATMELISSGALTGCPNPYLVLSSSVIGFFLSECYKAEPEFNWYTIYLLTCYTIPFLVLYYRSLSTFFVFSTVLKIGVLFTIQYQLLLELQFTVASLVMVAVAFLLFMQVAQNKVNFNLFVASILLCFAFLIRFESIYVFSIVALPVIFYKTYLTKKYWVVFYVVASLSMGYVITVLDHSIMSNKVGYDLFSFIRATETIIDNPNTIQQSDLDEVGWSSKDLELMKLYFFLDQEIYSPDKVIHLANGKRGNRTIKMIIEEAVSLFKGGYIYLLIYFFLLLQIRLQSVKYGNPVFAQFMLLIAIISLLIIFLLLYVRLPFHLFLPLILIPAFFAIDTLLFSHNKFTIPLVLLLILSLYIKNEKALLKRNNLIFNLHENLHYMSRFPDKIFHNTNIAIYGGAFCGIRNKMYDKPKNLLLFGWVIGTPAYFDHLNLHKLSQNSLSGICTRPDILFISQSPVFLELIEAQFNSKGAHACSFDLFNQQGNIRVFKAY